MTAPTDLYVHHRLTCAPLQWQAVADALRAGGSATLEAAGGMLYGVWRSQIGAPRDEVNVITAWPGGLANAAGAAARAANILTDGVDGIRHVASAAMAPTVRPAPTASGLIEPPRRQGNFAFRWFDTPVEHWQEFLDLCTSAWPGFESSYDSQIVGLWRFLERDDGQDPDAMVRTLLMTRRPDLAMWERSKLPANAEEAEVRRKLSRRYDLCEWTTVFTTTLLTAEDKVDEARWA